MPALVLVVAYATRERALHPLLTRLASWAGERFAGYELEIGALEGDWLHGLGVRDVRLEPLSPDATLQGFTAEHLALRYDAWPLLRGDLGGLRALEGRGVDLRLELAGDGEEDEDDDGPSVWPSLPERLPDASLEGVSLDLGFRGGHRLRVRAAALEVEARGAQPAGLTLQAERVSWLDGQGVERGAAVRARATYDAGRVAIDEVRVDDEVLARPSSVDLSRLSERRIAWDLALAPVGARASTRGELALPKLEASAEVTGADAERVARELARWGLPLAPPDEHAAAGVDARLDARASVVLDLDRPEEIRAELHLEARELAYVGRTADALDLHVELDADRLQLHSGSLAHPSANVRLGGGTFARDDEGRWRLDAALELRAEDLALVRELVRAGPDWAGSAAGSVRVSGTWPDLEGRVDLTGERVSVAGLELGAIELEAAVGGRAVSVARLSAEGTRGTLAASGGVRYDGSLDDVRLEVDLARSGELAAFLADGGTLRVSARLDGAWDELSGELSAEGSDLRLGPEPVERLELAARAVSGDLVVERLALEARYGALTAAGRVADPFAGGDVVVELDELALESDGAGLTLLEPAVVVAGPSGVRAAELRMAGPSGGLALELESGEGRTRLVARAEELDPTPFLAPFLAGELALEGVTGSVELALDPDRPPRGSAQLVVPRVTGLPVGDPWSLDVHATLDLRRLELEHLRVGSGDDPVADLSGSAPLDPTGEELLPEGELALVGTLRVPLAPVEPAPGWSLAGRLDADVNLAGTWRDVRGRADVAGELALSESTGGATVEHPGALHAEVVLDGAVQVEGVTLELPELAGLAGGVRVGAPLDVTGLLERGLDVWRDAPLQGAVRLDVPDMSRVAPYVVDVGNGGGLRRIQGRARGELLLAGTPAAPELSGEVVVADGELRVASALPPLRDVAGALRLEGRDVVVDDLGGDLGASRLTISGRVHDVVPALAASEQEVADPPRLALGLKGENVLLVRTAGARVRADVDVSVEGPLEELTVTGELALRNTRIAQRIDLLALLQPDRDPPRTGRGFTLFSLREPPLAATRFDVQVDSVEPIVIEGNLVRASLAVDGHLGGTGEVPLPSGRMFVSDARAAMPAGLVRFPGGVITFSRDDPFVPRLDLNGEARMAGYDVNVVVSGPYDRPEIELSSSPPLPNQELLLLFLTGRPPSQGQTLARTGQTVFLYLAKDLLTGADAGRLDEGESLLERLEIRSGSDVSASGVETIEATIRVVDGLWAERDAVYLVGERDVHEDYNFGTRLVFRFR